MDKISVEDIENCYLSVMRKRGDHTDEWFMMHGHNILRNAMILFCRIETMKGMRVPADAEVTLAAERCMQILWNQGGISNTIWARLRRWFLYS